MFCFIRYVAVWTGVLSSAFSGLTTFTINLNGGVRFYLGSALLIDSWIEKTATLNTSVPLKLGDNYVIRVENFGSTASGYINLGFGFDFIAFIYLIFGFDLKIIKFRKQKQKKNRWSNQQTIPLNQYSTYNPVNATECNCFFGYQGETCDIFNITCRPDLCINGGTCVQLASSYQCLCLNGFTGLDCNISES